MNRRDGIKVKDLDILKLKEDLSEDRKRYGLALGLSVSDNMMMGNYNKFSHFLMVQKKDINKTAKEEVKSLNIKTPSINQLVKNLSGGNQQKVVIANWLIKECKNYLENGLEPVKISYDEKLDMMEYHLNKLCEDKSERQAVLEMRMHLLNYLKGMPDASNIKNLVCKGKRREEIINILESYRNQIKSL